MVFAIFIGAWASDLSENAAIRKWEKTHLPSKMVLEFATRSRGMSPIHEVRHLQKILRSLSVGVDDKGAFWLSDDSNWMAFFSGGEDSLTPQVYCLSCAHLPAQWSPIGLGWRGLEEAMIRIDKQIEILKSHIPMKRSQAFRPFRDARAIEY